MRHPSSAPIRNGLFYWLSWTAAGLFYVSQDFMTRLSRNEAIPLGNIVIGWMSAMYICAAFTPLILSLGRRFSLLQHPRGRSVSIHLAISLAFSLLSTALEVPILVQLGMLPSLATTPFLRDLWYLLPYDLHGGIVRYWAVIGLQALIYSNREVRHREGEALQLKVHASQLAEQLSSSQLAALKMQLHPHFLFNTLGAAMVLVRQQKSKEAETMLSRLSDLLRLTLEDVHAQEIPLWRELEYLRTYLSIEQVRFEDRLRVCIDSDPALSDALVPHMALQPVVENAVRHGLGQSEDPILIHVAITCSNGCLTLTVTDDGPGCPTPVLEEKGIGLSNTRLRLTRLYGDAATLAAHNRKPRGVEVTMTLPYRTTRAAEEEDPCAS